MPRFGVGRDVLGHDGQGDLLAVRKDDGTLDRILQLPHVARPVISCEGKHRFFRESFDRFVVLVGVQLQKMHGQQLYVFLAFTKGGDSDVDNVQAIEKIFAESLLFDFLVKVLV